MKRFLLIIVLLSSVLFTLDSISAPDDTLKTAPESNRQLTQPSSSRLWNLQDADILSIINEVSLETGKNFVVDPRVSGKITLISSKPIKTGEVYAVFLSILESLGYSAIPSGDIVKIIPNMESAEMATRVASKRSPGNGGEVVVRVMPLEHVSAAQLIPIIRPMLPQWSNLSVYTPGNVLILTGRAANLQRILNVIKSVDKDQAMTSISCLCVKLLLHKSLLFYPTYKMRAEPMVKHPKFQLRLMNAVIVFYSAAINLHVYICGI